MIHLKLSNVDRICLNSTTINIEKSKLVICLNSTTINIEKSKLVILVEDKVTGHCLICKTIEDFRNEGRILFHGTAKYRIPHQQFYPLSNILNLIFRSYLKNCVTTRWELSASEKHLISSHLLDSICSCRCF